MENDRNPGQQEFLQRLENLLGLHVLNEEGREVLGLKRDAWYRRRRGEVSLSLDEAIKLSGYFQVPLIADQSDFTALFSVSTLIRTVDDYRTSLEKNLVHLETLARTPRSRFILVSKDLPFFYTFLSPGLNAFKVFLWLRILYGVEEARKWEHWTDVPQDLLDLGKKVGLAYAELEVTEIWGRNTLDGLLHQFDYCLETGLFRTRDEALQLIEELDGLLLNLQQQAMEGRRLFSSDKPLPAEYELYIHDLLIPDNQMLAILPDQEILFLPMAGHYLPTNNRALTEYMNVYLQTQYRQSLKVTGGSEKVKSMVFMKMRQRLAKERERISAASSFTSRW